MLHKTSKLLLDINLSCGEILDFIDGKSFEDFQENRMLQLAIEREFEIIGEALHRLSRIEEAAMLDFAVNRVPELVEKVENY